MATSLLDGLKSMVTPEFLAGAARNLGESEGAVATGLGAAFRHPRRPRCQGGGFPDDASLFDLISSPATMAA